MPVHLKIPICIFTFSDNPLLTPQNIAKVNMYVNLKFGSPTWEIWQKVHFSNKLLVVVVQFQTLYLKNCTRYRSEILHTSRVQYPDVQ